MIEERYNPMPLLRKDNAIIRIGKNVEFGHFVEIGEKADYDDLYKNPDKYKRRLISIGDNVIIKSHVTIHAPIFDVTYIGDNCLIMPFSHIAHDVILGENVHIALAKLGGHTKVHDYGYIGLNSATHQFSTIGAFSLVGGGSFVIKDIPPFLIFVTGKGCYKINIVGLKRAGYSQKQIESVELYYAGGNIDDLDPALVKYIKEFKKDSRRKTANIWIEDLV